MCVIVRPFRKRFVVSVCLVLAVGVAVSVDVLTYNLPGKHRQAPSRLTPEVAPSGQLAGRPVDSLLPIVLAAAPREVSGGATAVICDPASAIRVAGADARRDHAMPYERQSRSGSLVA